MKTMVPAKAGRIKIQLRNVLLLDNMSKNFFMFIVYYKRRQGALKHKDGEIKF